MRLRQVFSKKMAYQNTRIHNTKNRLSKSLLFFMMAVLLCSVRANVTDPCEVYKDTDQLQCVTCATDFILALLSDDRVFCAQKDTADES